jgi:alginate O-acetyltransferase complex protein AlgI
MTLGAWVKDYLYIPMGGNRHGELRKMRNLFASMLIIGLWHGAGWTFIIWGGLHGLFLMINHQWRRLKINLPQGINWGLTFLCVVVCWVFFRADTSSHAIAVLTAMTDIQHICLPSGGFYEHHLAFLSSCGVEFVKWPMPGSLFNIMTILGLISLSLALCPNPQNLLTILHNHPRQLEALAGVLGFVFAVTLLALGHIESEFLYFQF